MEKTLKTIITIITIFMFLDCVATCIAQDMFITRIAVENNIELKDIEYRKKEYEFIKQNQLLNWLSENLWNNKKMIKTFPNIKVEDIDNNQIYLDSLLKDIQPYYLKVYDKKP